MTSGIQDSGEITRRPGIETAVLAGGQNDHATYRNHPGHARRSRSFSTRRGRRTATSWRSSSRSTTRRR
jgi:hypothetical protein